MTQSGHAEPNRIQFQKYRRGWHHASNAATVHIVEAIYKHSGRPYPDDRYRMGVAVSMSCSRAVR